jgi:hypothetical protein
MTTLSSRQDILQRHAGAAEFDGKPDIDILDQVEAAHGNGH